MIWKFRSGARWREMPPEFGVWQTVYDRFVRWRDAGVFLALMDGVIAEAAQRGQTDLALVSVDSTIARALITTPRACESRRTSCRPWRRPPRRQRGPREGPKAAGRR
ncbi:transposase [Streptomyces sp. ECR3.8]|uniref:transposase n=1 Tax=Streptomyces sp. ECR3.8 TaxID=3461009 RepID=UPI00404165E9